MRQGMRVAVSGTYSSGKSTTTEALSLLTGIPRTHAKTSREILLEVLPGKEVQELSAKELILLGLHRLEERIVNEERAMGSFFSDGSVLHEWIYGQARMIAGINPSAGLSVRLIKELVGLPYKRFYQGYMEAYGRLVKARAKRLYDVFIHLPVEFPMVADNHRPVSEKFRHLSDEILIETLDELKIKYHLVGGSIEERLHQIIDLLALPTVMPFDEAVAIAKERVAELQHVLETDARYHANQREKSLWRRIAYTLRY